MNIVIKDSIIKQDCSQKEFLKTTFENCHFDHLIYSDIKLVDVTFLRCKFTHVFMESFYAKDISIVGCEILSMSLRGDRKITERKLFQIPFDRKIESVKFENTRIEELVLGGNLQIVNCDFPKGENYLHIKEPFKIYSKCKNYIAKNWEGEKKRLGLIEIQKFFLDKQVEKQNEDFIAYAYNSDLDSDVNGTIKSVFTLVKELSMAV
jgi:hypothetical protein